MKTAAIVAIVLLLWCAVLALVIGPAGLDILLSADRQNVRTVIDAERVAFRAFALTYATIVGIAVAHIISEWGKP